MPEVKQLEWSGVPNWMETCHSTFPLRYFISRDFVATAQFDDDDGLCNKILGKYSTLEEARDACQKHWNALVLSWLEEEEL